MKPRALLLSAYDAASHRRWRQGLVAHVTDWDFEVLTLPPRHFAWRIRGNPLTWSQTHRDIVEREYDGVVATSMVDVATLRGLVPSLSCVPFLTYFHENQFAYPRREDARLDANLAMLQIYTALASDRIVFNSAYNRDSMLDGMRQFLASLPDGVPSGIDERIAERSEVIPVPLEDAWFAGRPVSGADAAGSREGPLRLLWNHRWEYDKAPERFFRALYALDATGLEFELHVVGQQFRQVPAIFEEAESKLSAHIRTWGYLEERADYAALLSSCDVVVSTALHEFQGLAVLEAVAAGCRPLVPDRLAYRELIPATCRYASFVDDEDREVEALADELTALAESPDRARRDSRADVEDLRWSNLAPRYARELATTRAVRRG